MSRLARLGFVSSLSAHGVLFAAAAGLTSSSALYGVAAGNGAIEVALVSKKAAPKQKAILREEGLPVLPKKAEEEASREEAGEIGVESLESGSGASTLAQPNYLRNPPPAYPELSRRRREEGIVYLLVHVSSEGTVKEISVGKSSGFSRLDEAALKSVKGWEFQPAKANGFKVDSRVEVPVRFRLDS
jgi:periplasmic protein TonB